jgi:type I restriction enzyme R subunit
MKTIEQELADDPFAQNYFSQLLRQAIAEAQKLFEHPFKQYALFKDFDQKVANRDMADVPEAITGNKHARAYFGILKLVIGEDKQNAISTEALVDAALTIESAVKTAVSEQSLNPQNIEAAIRQALLPKLFALLGLDKAKEVIERVIAVTRIGISRGEL